MAFMTAAGAPVVAFSPAPFTPSGLSGSAISFSSTMGSGRSTARGMAYSLRPPPRRLPFFGERTAGLSGRGAVAGGGPAVGSPGRDGGVGGAPAGGAARAPRGRGRAGGGIEGAPPRGAALGGRVPGGQEVGPPGGARAFSRR